MPELLVLLRRNISRSSKSPAVPPFQTRKVLPLAGFSLVVSPRMTPSLTDQSLGSPSPLVRSLPLNRFSAPCCCEAAACCAGSSAKAGLRANRTAQAAITWGRMDRFLRVGAVDHAAALRVAASPGRLNRPAAPAAQKAGAGAQHH